ncbi:short-chain dehydrogenase/reductase SDR [Rhodococcus ruber BKS 20-38]|uniref:3-oxoacyl-[acyl-carrier-protein] reductase MabA n=1 Tax=Rhodococcus ruber BKS 20-38 TaxID=1278076 RepID=M2YVC5_9NOCA|nr:SDR family NAD(P)-dependent oxidoreductase [Rhodococcus ruber]EME52603.1 short-chain dehydrogenase/reductase SDR [Rhodococcus ruber BKS 20-38]
MSTDNNSLKGRVALVTGSGRGLGRAIAESLACAGAHVWVVSRNHDELDEVVTGIRAAGGSADAAAVDLRDGTALEALRNQVSERTPVVDIVVNNAGINRKKPVVPVPDEAAGTQPGAGPVDLAMSDDDWNSILDTHVRGSLHLIRAFVPAMLEQRHGRIVNIGSSSTLRSPDYCVPYQVAKGSLDHLTRGLAKEWAPYGVTVNSIAPGHFRTSMTKALHDSEDGQAWLRQRIPMRRTGNPAELGALTVHLAGDLASFITGQTIYVDGGETL